MCAVTIVTKIIRRAVNQPGLISTTLHRRQPDLTSPWRESNSCCLSLCFYYRVDIKQKIINYLISICNSQTTCPKLNVYRINNYISKFQNQEHRQENSINYLILKILAVCRPPYLPDTTSLFCTPYPKGSRGKFLHDRNLGR